MNARDKQSIIHAIVVLKRNTDSIDPNRENPIDLLCRIVGKYGQVEWTVNEQFGDGRALPPDLFCEAMDNIAKQYPDDGEGFDSAVMELMWETLAGLGYYDGIASFRGSGVAPLHRGTSEVPTTDNRLQNTET